MSQRALVTTNPEVCGGRPCFAGHRVPIEFVLGRLDAGERLADMQGDSFPWLTAAHIAAAREYVSPEPTRRFGSRKGSLPAEFDEPLPPEVLDSFDFESPEAASRVSASTSKTDTKPLRGLL